MSYQHPKLILLGNLRVLLFFYFRELDGRCVADPLSRPGQIQIVLHLRTLDLGFRFAVCSICCGFLKI